MSSVCPSVCLSIRLSVTMVNCDHTGWNSSKIISPLVSLGCSLFATPTSRVCSKGNTPKFGPKVTHLPIDLSFGDIRSQIAAEWLQIAQRSLWRAYRKLPPLFLMVSSLTPYNLPPKKGSICPQCTRMAISLQRVIRSTSCLVLGWGFRGRRIERSYLRFEQIQDSGRRHVGKISNGHISATGRPIHFMFGYRVGFSGTADLMALFSI